MEDFSGLFASVQILIILAIIVLLILTPIIILMIVANWKMYKKAGKNGWESIVPFYSKWVYAEIAGLNWWWFFLLIAGSVLTISTSNSNGETVSINLGAFVTLFGTFVCNYNIAKKLHKDVGFAVLMTIFPIVLIPLIAFSDKYQFDNDVPVSKNGPIPDGSSNNTTSSNNNDSTEKKDVKYCPNCGAELEKDAKFCNKCGKEV